LEPVSAQRNLEGQAVDGLPHIAIGVGLALVDEQQRLGELLDGRNVVRDVNGEPIRSSGGFGRGADLLCFVPAGRPATARRGALLIRPGLAGGQPTGRRKRAGKSFEREAQRGG
jgi:hypothetical protein